MLNWIKTHRYCLIVLYLLVFFAGFFSLQVIIDEPKYILHCFIDDLIPFNEWFVLPYFLWYPWFPGALLYFMIKDKAAFLKLCFVMFVGMTFCLAAYVIWPNGLDLRREITADNFCADIVRFLRSIDPPCNVCPSIHVSSTTAVHRVICSSASFRDNGKAKWVSRVVTLAICMSTMFIKQHSIIDVACGWALTEVLAVVYTEAERRHD